MDRLMDKDVIHTHTHTHTMEHYSQCEFNGTCYKKEWNLAICNNMEELRGCYAKWSKSDIERQIPYDLTTMWYLKKNIKTK